MPEFKIFLLNLRTTETLKTKSESSIHQMFPEHQDLQINTALRFHAIASGVASTSLFQLNLSTASPEHTGDSGNVLGIS